MEELKSCNCAGLWQDVEWCQAILAAEKNQFSALNLLRASDGLVPLEDRNRLRDVAFESGGNGNNIGLPCPLKETEAVAALKAVEASTVATIIYLSFGMDKRDIRIGIERAIYFFFFCISLDS